VHGIYYNTLNKYLNLYPFIKKLHSHDFYSVLIFTKGKGTITINNNVSDVQPQTICLVAPNQMHSFGNLKEVEGIILFFCQDFYVEEFSFIRLLYVFSYTAQLERNCNPLIALSDKEFSPVFTIIKSIEHEYKSFRPDNNSAVIIRSLVNIMLLKLSDLYTAKLENPNKIDNILIYKLSQLIDTYFIQEQQVRFYTTACNVSESQLNIICNKYFNCGLKKILQNRLMQEARKLLLTSNLSVAEIAFKLNFEDNSYFNKVFKNKTGITPKKFQELHKKLVP
jgi:AraC-like DNA-binding protein